MHLLRFLPLELPGKIHIMAQILSCTEENFTCAAYFGQDLPSLSSAKSVSRYKYTLQYFSERGRLQTGGDDGGERKDMRE
jgi:hypothetical protein